MGANCCRIQNPCRSFMKTFEESILRQNRQPLEENVFSAENRLYWVKMNAPVLPENTPVSPGEFNSVLPEAIDSVFPEEIESVLHDENGSVLSNGTVLREEINSFVQEEGESTLPDENNSILSDEISSILIDESDSSSSEESDSASSVSWLSFEDECTGLGQNVFMDDERTCSVCTENYNEEDNQPRIIPCGHIICNMCLSRIAKTRRYKKMKCPQDRQVFKLRRRKIYDIQSSVSPDFEIISKEEIRVASVRSISSTQTHSLSRSHNLNDNTESETTVTKLPAFVEHLWGDGIPSIADRDISSTQTDSLSNSQNFNNYDSIENLNFENRYNHIVPKVQFSDSGVFLSRERFLANVEHETTDTKIPAFVKHLWGEENFSSQERCQYPEIHCHMLSSCGTHSTAWFGENRISEPPPDYPMDEDDFQNYSYA